MQEYLITSELAKDTPDEIAMSHLSQRLQTFLENHKVINVAYSDKNGEIHACALWYASDSNLNMYVLSSVTTRHGEVFSSKNDIAFTINRDDQDWRSIRGVQGNGQINKLENPEIGWGVYITKFPFVKNEFTDIQQALSKTTIWLIRPSWFRLIDNTIAFGHKEEWTP